MQGGDYRKAGRREGQQQVSLGELRSLLEDDVKNLHRREQQNKLQSNDENLPKNNTACSIDWIQRDISEAELDLIMDRTKLFPEYAINLSMNCASTSKADIDVANLGRIQKDSSRLKKRKINEADVDGFIEEDVTLDYHDYNHAVSEAMSPIKTTSSEGHGNTKNQKMSSIDSTLRSDGVDAGLVAIWDSERKATESAGVQGVVPLEGEMYDIIPESKAAQVLLSLN